MPRYFIEVSYRGTNYSGFQTQINSNTIQDEIEKALKTVVKKQVSIIGSSRTDAGVHALQNFFHFDTDLSDHIKMMDKYVYNLNAIVPDDIVIKRIFEVSKSSHSRFDAISREYKYYIHQQKDPFLKDRAFFFPYTLDIEKMNCAAKEILNYIDFTSFSKRNTQVKTFKCAVSKSCWMVENDLLVYNVKANRFLRGMVRALTATLLKVGRGKISVDEFQSIINSKDCTKASFNVPAHGLFLVSVDFMEDSLKPD